MTNNMMAWIAKREGYCCLYKMIRHYDGLSSTSAAKRLGVAAKTVNFWRARIRTGECLCMQTCDDPILNPKGVTAPQKTPEPPSEGDGNAG